MEDVKKIGNESLLFKEVFEFKNLFWGHPFFFNGKIDIRADFFCSLGA